MRHRSAQVVAILIGMFCSARSPAADVIVECTDCAVAAAIARALQEDDGDRLGLRLGDGDWLFSVASRHVRFGITVGFTEQIIPDPAMDDAMDPDWTIGLRFEIGAR